MKSYIFMAVKKKVVCKETNRRQNDTAGFQTHSETECWEDLSHLHIIDSTMLHPLVWSWKRRIYTPQSSDAPTWRPWRLRKPAVLWDHKRLCGTPSHHAGMTWVNMWSPCRWVHAVNTFEKPHTNIFWNILTFFNNSTCHPLCQTDIIILNEKIV